MLSFSVIYQMHESLFFIKKTTNEFRTLTNKISTKTYKMNHNVGKGIVTTTRKTIHKHRSKHAWPRTYAENSMVK